MKIILATSSRYRRQAFGFLGVDFEVEDSGVGEQFKGRPSDSRELVRRLAKLKAEAVAKKYKSGIVVGFDSVGFFQGKILEKPKSRKEALARLKALSGKRHQFITGVYMININNNQRLEEVSITDVWLRKLSDEEINRYLDEGEKYKTFSAGFNPLEQYSATFVKKIEGSYNNFLRGVPLEAIVGMLRKLGQRV